MHQKRKSERGKVQEVILDPSSPYNQVCLSPRLTTADVCFMLEAPVPPAPVASSRPPSPFGPVAPEQFWSLHFGMDKILAAAADAKPHAVGCHSSSPPWTQTLPILPSFHSYSAMPIGPSRCSWICTKGGVTAIQYHVTH